MRYNDLSKATHRKLGAELEGEPKIFDVNTSNAEPFLIMIIFYAILMNSKF